MGNAIENIVQIDKDYIVQIGLNHEWCGALVQVTNVNECGVRGYINIPNKGLLFVNLKHDEYYVIGKAALICKEVEE